MTLDYVLNTYGYFALTVGTFLEGETVLVAAGFLAHQGYLKLPWVVLFAFLGALAGGQFYFFLGRDKGRDFIESRPRCRVRSTHVSTLVKNYQVAVVLGFRFLIGMRTVTPFILGAGGLNPVRFVIWNTIGAGIWAATVAALGYLFGQTVDVLLKEAEKYELWIIALIFIIGILIWTIHVKRRTP